MRYGVCMLSKEAVTAIYCFIFMRLYNNLMHGSHRNRNTTNINIIEM